MWIMTNDSYLSIVSKDCGPAELLVRVRIPEKATTLSGAWRPRDAVDDDQGGARA
jgi:hypothetical protein